MTRSLLLLLMVCSFFALRAQPVQISLGLFSGITSSYTWDEGINNDARYRARYDVKFTPIGLYYGVDYSQFGFGLAPSITNIGQNYHVINTVGGHEGTRAINLRYFSFPLTLKYHVIDLSFFRVSLAGGIGLGYLMDGRETITHNYAKYRFPAAVYPILPSDYVIEYDGVIAPEQQAYPMLEKNDFKKLQFFGSAGFRSDWEISDVWRVSLDVRMNYGILDPRSDSYLNEVASNATLYDIHGTRRDIFASVSIGISRYIEIDPKKEAHNKSGKFVPKKYPFVKPNRGKPRGRH